MKRLTLILACLAFSAYAFTTNQDGTVTLTVEEQENTVANFKGLIEQHNQDVEVINELAKRLKTCQERQEI